MEASAKPETQYRSVSGLAIIALVLGIASALSLVTPLLLIIPIATLFVAAMALRQIARQPDITSGRGLALAGVFLAIFFLAYLPTRFYLRSQVLAEPAKQVGEAFLTLVKEGKTYEAHQLSLQKFLARDPNRPLAQYYAEDEDASGSYQRFLDSPAMQKLQSLQGKYTYRYVGIEPGIDRTGKDVLTVQFVVEPTESTKRPFPFWISVMRSVDERTGAATWQMGDVRLTATPTGR
jgi:hypothetical protein